MIFSKVSSQAHLNTYSYESLVKDIGTRIVGDFFYYGKVYATTNELEHGKVVEALKKTASVGNLVIGTAGFCTLNLAAVRKDVKYILICDLSVNVQFFWTNIEQIIKKKKIR